MAEESRRPTEKRFGVRETRGSLLSRSLGAAAVLGTAAAVLLVGGEVATGLAVLFVAASIAAVGMTVHTLKKGRR